jgi:hypothetical protein
MEAKIPFFSSSLGAVPALVGVVSLCFLNFD